MESKHSGITPWFCWLFLSFLWPAGSEAAAPRQPTGTLRLEIVEKRPGRDAAAVAARVHLIDPAGQPVRAPGLPFFRDHFCCDGGVRLEVAEGTYGYTVERGPEYRRAIGKVRVAAGKVADVKVALERWIDMADAGWWSGETHVHRPLEEMNLHLRAEDLHVAPVLTVWNKKNAWATRTLPAELLVEVEPTRFYHQLACEDERRGGALLYFNLQRPLDFRADRPEYPSPVASLEASQDQPGVWVDIEKPFWWDVPTWVATGKVDSIGLANNHMCRSTMYASEAWGRPRDTERLPPPRGNGFYSQELYYRLLNCGFRLPPSAGSASGVLPNPVGYNRVYVHVDGEFSYAAWWRGLASGRSFVTNGPMLLVKANGRPPGSVFRVATGKPQRLDLDIHVAGNDPLEAVEVIRDGEVAARLECDELKARLPIQFDRSGWFLVRAIARVPETFRFASTAPFFVEIGGRRDTIHRADVEYFLAWIDERIRILQADKAGHLRGDGEKRAVLAPHRRARKVFSALLDRAE